MFLQVMIRFTRSLLLFSTLHVPRPDPGDRPLLRRTKSWASRFTLRNLRFCAPTSQLPIKCPKPVVHSLRGHENSTGPRVRRPTPSDRTVSVSIGQRTNLGVRESCPDWKKTRTGPKTRRRVQTGVSGPRLFPLGLPGGF